MDNNEIAVYKAISKNHDSTHGKCGLSHVGVMQETGLDFEQSKQAVISLYNEKIIIVRKGLNGKLYFCNDKKERPVF